MVLERIRYPKSSSDTVKELKQARDEGQLEEKILEIFAGYEMDMVVIWKCREFLYELSDEFYTKNPGMLAYRIIIEAMKGTPENAWALIEPLGNTPDDLNNYKLDAINFARIMLEMVLPQMKNEEYLRRARFIASHIDNPVTGLALTACRPSVINGFRDFTFLCPKMDGIKDNLQNTIYKLYGKAGDGVYETALAEWKYEAGDVLDALVLVAGIIPALENAKDIRCLFAAYVLHMRILYIKDQTKSIPGMFEKIRSRIRETHFEELEASLDAVECLYDCYQGNDDEVKQWLTKKAPDEYGEIFMMDMYSYLVKMRCYIQTGQYMMTILLSRKLLEMIKIAERPHDNCECYILSAIACMQADDMMTAKCDFEKALAIGLEYGYVRIFADEGKQMLSLIKLCEDQWEDEGTDISDDQRRLLKNIKSMAKEIAGRFPNYLKVKKNKSELMTPTEMKILLLIEQGMSNGEIAQKLGKKEGAVKYHTSGIYKKLNVANRAQAIVVARDHGIIV